MATLKIRRIFDDLIDFLIERYRGDKEDIEVLIDTIVKRCVIADREHYKSRRSYAHTNHEPMTVCVSGSIDLLPINNIKGILVHEIGHIIHLNFPELVNDLEVGLSTDEEDTYLGVSVDQEVFADAIIYRLYDLHIFYDENKVQWITTKWLTGKEE